MVLESLRDHICDLIHIYYGFNPSGGNLHTALEGGILSDAAVFYCQELCADYQDEMGYTIATVMRLYTVAEREKMYENKWSVI